MCIKKRHLFFFLFLGLTTSAWAWEFSTPTVRFQQALGVFHDRYEGFPNLQERFDASVEQNLNHAFTTDLLAFRATPWLWLKAPQAVGGDARDFKPFFDLKEGWMDYSSPNWEIRFGNQLITWGAADQINPTDLWNGSDFSDPLQPNKLPVLTARVILHPTTLENIRLELIGTPLFRETLLPLEIPDSGSVFIRREESRWLFPLPTRFSASILTAPLRYQMFSPTYPSTWQAGARLQVLRLWNWDFSVSYQNLVEKTPRVAVTTTGDPNDPNFPLTVQLYPSYHRMQAFGTDGSGYLNFDETVIGVRYEFVYGMRDNSRAESAEAQYRQDLIKDDYIQGVLGLDHTLQTSILGTGLYLNAMFVFFERVNKHETRTGTTSSISGLPNLDSFDRNAIMYIENRFSEAWTLGHAFLYSFRFSDGVYLPSLSFNATDHLKFSLSSSFIFGSSNSSHNPGFYSQFSENDRTILTVNYVF